jgi:peptidoglycan/xylan/chitin deacetylase (PgdA/CDA1 family)
MKPRRYGPFPYLPIHQRPKISWPDDARVALWVIPNLEFFPLDVALRAQPNVVPNVAAWAYRDYGARVGVWRLMEVMARHGIRGTAATNSDVCEAYPQIIEEAVKLDWEFIGHNQTNAQFLNEFEPDDERKEIHDTFAIIEGATGQKPKGWLGAGIMESWHSLDYLIDEGCQYVADWVNDDQPYLMDVEGKQIVSIPYTSDLNDFPQLLQQGRSGEEFANMIRNAFDVLYREGETSGRVMAISLHPFLIGTAHTIGAFDAALEYVCGHDGVWLATGGEIIDHYLNSGATF